MKRYVGGLFFVVGLLSVGMAQADASSTAKASNQTMSASNPDVTAGAADTKARTYVGLSLGASRTDSLANSLDNVSGLQGGSEPDNSASGFKGYVGVMADRHLGFQFAYVNLGSFDLEEMGAFPATYSFSSSVKAKGLYANLLLELPFGKDVGAAYVKGGAGFARIEQTADGTTLSGQYSLSQKDTTLSMMAGLGLRFNLGKHWGMMLEGERYFVPFDSKGSDDGKKTAKIDLYSLGVYYRF